jgi:hypothetical protein
VPDGRFSVGGMTQEQTSKRAPILPMLAYEDGPAAID